MDKMSPTNHPLYVILNESRKQYLNPHSFGTSCSLRAIMWDQFGPMPGLSWLILETGGMKDYPSAGSWVGDSLKIMSPFGQGSLLREYENISDTVICDILRFYSGKFPMEKCNDVNPLIPWVFMNPANRSKRLRLPLGENSVCSEPSMHMFPVSKYDEMSNSHYFSDKRAETITKGLDSMEVDKAWKVICDWLGVRAGADSRKALPRQIKELLESAMVTDITGDNVSAVHV